MGDQGPGTTHLLMLTCQRLIPGHLCVCRWTTRCDQESRTLDRRVAIKHVCVLAAAAAAAGTRRRGLSPTVRVLLAPKEAAAGGLLQQRLQEQLDAAVQHPHHTVSAMPGGSIGMTEAAVLLRCVCATLVDGIKG
jgi:hypothetical protein